MQVVPMGQEAHDKHIRGHDYSQRAACFPADQCPDGRCRQSAPARAEGARRSNFKVYEDGRTAGRIQRNKGSVYRRLQYLDSRQPQKMLQAYLQLRTHRGQG